MRVYDQVLKILRENVQTRDSDKVLLWEFWKSLGLIKAALDSTTYINKYAFLHQIPALETVTRARRRIQETHPELRSNPGVQRMKDKKKATQGTFIFRETI